ncbi:MAG: flippase-like domain-containing protein [Actinobacteria bacterium]|nr:MAG: flippase-like domain-containing protein [Actinomycetota bacterium]
MNLESQNKKSKKRWLILRIINIVVVVGLGVFLVYYLLNQIDIEDIKSAFINIYTPSLIIGLILIFSIDFFRAYRAKILIGSGRIRMVDMFLVSLIRNGFNMVLPARTGELSYIYVLKRKFKFPVEIGISTLMIALVFDLIIVFSMIVISIIIVGINKYAVSSTSVILIAVALLISSLLVLFYLSKFVGLFIKIFDRILSKYRVSKSKVIQNIYKKLVETNKNIELIKKRGIYWKVYLISVPSRILKYAAYYFLIHAVLKPMGFGFNDLSYWVIILATAAAEISAVLPTHSLAGLGTYQGVFALAFIMLGFGKEISIIVGFSYHIINLIFTIAWCLIAMVILSLPVYRIKEQKYQESGK